MVPRFLIWNVALANMTKFDRILLFKWLLSVASGGKSESFPFNCDKQKHNDNDGCQTSTVQRAYTMTSIGCGL